MFWILKKQCGDLDFLYCFSPYSDVNPELKISIYHEPANIKIQNLNPELKSKIK